MQTQACLMLALLACCGNQQLPNLTHWQMLCTVQHCCRIMAARSMSSRRCSFNAAGVLRNIVAYHHYSPAALQTREAVWGLLDALVAAEADAAQQQAELQQGSDALRQLESCIILLLSHVQIVGRSAVGVDGDGDSYPELAMLSEGLLRPGVVTALLKAGTWWSEAPVGGGTSAGLVCDPLYTLREGLCHLQRRRPQAGLDPQPPHFTAETHDLQCWPQLLARSLMMRLGTRPGGTGMAAGVIPGQQNIALHVALALLSTSNDSARMGFSGSTSFCGAVAAYVGDTAADPSVWEAAAKVSAELLCSPMATSSMRLAIWLVWTSSSTMRGLLQMVSFRGRSVGNYVTAQAQQTASAAAHSLLMIALKGLDMGQPSSIAAHPGAAASIVSGMRICLSRHESSGSSSSDFPDEASLRSQVATLTTLCNVMGTVALADPPVGSTWASVMMRMAPLRELNTLVTSGGLAWQLLIAIERSWIASGLYAVAATHAEVLHEQQQQQQQRTNGSPQQVDEQAALINDCMETAMRVLALTGASGVEEASKLLCHLPWHRMQLARMGGVLSHIVQRATNVDARTRAASIKGLHSIAAEWLEQQHQDGQIQQLLPPPEFANRACPDSACLGHTGSNWFVCRHACEAPEFVPSALKAAEAPLRVLAGAAATDPQLAAQAELALEALQGCRAQVEEQQPAQQEAAVESTAQLMQAALSMQDEAACGACSKTAADGVKLQRCIGCKAVWFCSLECQRVDWRSPTGHKAACKVAQQLQQQEQAASPAGAEDVAA